MTNPAFDSGKVDNDRIGDWIQTYAGKIFYPLDVRPWDIDPLDITHALALKCRYSGHCKRFYSVAEHAVLVSRECEKRWPDRPDLWLWGLLHDAGEAYLPDIPTPLKRMGIGCLEGVEASILDAVAAKFGLAPDIPPEVKEVDEAILADEAAVLMGPPPLPWNLRVPPAGIKIQCWTWEEARMQFANRWLELQPGVHS